MSTSKKRQTGSGNTSTRRPAVPPARKGTPSWLLWAGLAVVGVLAVVGLLAWQAGEGTELDVAGAKGTPNLVVDQTAIDFGDVPVNKMVKASFLVSNTGDGPLSLAVPPVPEVLEGC